MPPRFDKEFAQPIGARLEEARSALKMTVDEVARELGINARNVRRYENAEMTIGPKLLVRAAEVFDVSLDWLMRGVEDRPPAAFFRWLESPAGRAAKADHGVLVAGMRDLPLAGYQPPEAFYDEVLDALLSGTASGSPEQIVQIVRETLRERQS